MPTIAILDGNRKRVRATDADACRLLKAVIACDTSCGDDFADVPPWVRFELADELIDRLLRLRVVLANNDLDSVGFVLYPEYGPF